MTCEHLRPLERALVDAGLAVTYRGQTWTEAGEWVYFHCVLDLPACRALLPLPACVADHVHRGTHDGAEQGFYCEQCRDGVMGRLADAPPSVPRFPGTDPASG